jgi:hypothetical protein
MEMLKSQISFMSGCGGVWEWVAVVVRSCLVQVPCFGLEIDDSSA